MPDQEKEKELARLQNTVMEHHRGGEYNKALKAAQNLLKVTMKHFGKDHPATAAAYNNTGLMYKLVGDYIQARADYKKALQIYHTQLGVDHQSYATTLHNMGNLNRHQIHLDGDLSATDRLSLVQDALDWLKEAHSVRLAEFGPEHPHTVASRSAIGATLAVQILHQHKMTQRVQTESNLQTKRLYVSMLPTTVTETAWDAAHEHLRNALQTAMDHPRGTTVQQGAAQRASQRKPVPPDVLKVATASPLQTLSAANAAQNLAVFLKTRATTVEPYCQEWLDEAQQLYRQVLHVQAVLLHEGHPDVYATKHSLAELLDAAGDAETATALRQEMIDTFDPPKDGEKSSNSNTAAAAASVPEGEYSDKNDNGEASSETKQDSTLSEAAKASGTAAASATATSSNSLS